jgi:beta-N-acetylhexosaminidase
MLAALGFDLDFAPVVDLCPPAATNGIGDRSFGEDPEGVSTLAGAYLEGLTAAGILGCLKHFPGLGPTVTDSHHDLPTVRKPGDVFLRDDLAPYRRLHHLAPAIMVGHGHYPFFAGPEPVAATLTEGIVSGLLRSQIGFEGVAIADDLEMKAVAAHVGFDALAPRVVAAGCDMALVCQTREAVLASLRALESWAETGRLREDRIALALSRIQSLREAASDRSPEGLGAFQSAAADFRSSLGSMA